MTMSVDRAYMAGLSALADPSLKADLSPPALAMAQALDAGLGAALGVGKSLSEAGSDAIAGLAGDLAGTIGETAANIVGDVASAVPIVGAVVKAATAFIGALVAPFSEASKVQGCQSILHALAPQPTGSQLTGALTPADLFAPVFRMNGCDGSRYELPPGVPSMEASIGAQLVCACFGGPTHARSMLALVLMQLTEGAVVDVNDDWDWRFLHTRLSEQPSWKGRIKNTSAARQAWQRAVRRDVRIASAQWEAHAPKLFDAAADEWAKFGIMARPSARERRGLPNEWRTRFRNLRRGIEAAHGPSLRPGAVSDGGLGLWIVYVDLLATAFARGYLSPEFATFLLARQGASGSGAAAGLVSAEVYARWLLGLESDADLVRDADGGVCAPPTWVFGGTHEFDAPCPPVLISSTVLPLVRGWQHTVDPYYAQGQTKLSEIERAASVAPAQVTTSGPAPEQPDEPDERENGDGPSALLAGLGVLGGVALLFRLVNRR